MKKNMFIVFLLSALFIFMPENTFAIAQMQCSYQGVLSTFCGDSAGDDCKIDVVIKLEQNKFSLVSATWTNDFVSGVEGCGAGDDVKTCIDNYGVNNGKFSFDYIKAVKKVGNKYTQITDDSDYTTYFVSNSKYACPQNITILKHEDQTNNNFSIIVSNESFSSNYCDNGEINDFNCYQSDTFTLTDGYGMPYTGGTINSKPSSGSCCAYKYGAQRIYTYLLNNATGAKSYAVCFGDGCLTGDPNASSKAQYMPSSEDWGEYQNMSNCSNMPEYIWFTTTKDGKKVFYPSRPGNVGTTVRVAQLVSTEYCESNVYSSDGVLPNEKPDNTIDLGDQVEVSCQGILGEDLLDYIDKIFMWVKIAVPVILVVLGSIDFAQAVLLDDKDALKKATSKFIKRCIIAIVIFFIPTVLSFLLRVFNAFTTSGGISTCGIG